MHAIFTLRVSDMDKASSIVFNELLNNNEMPQLNGNFIQVQQEIC